jgi:hypothetical protein
MLVNHDLRTLGTDGGEFNQGDEAGRSMYRKMSYASNKMVILMTYSRLNNTPALAEHGSDMQTEASCITRHEQVMSH